MPKGMTMIQEALVSAPSAIAAGVGREMVAHAVNPSFAQKPVHKYAWWLDAATLALGVGGKVIEHATRNQTWGKASEGLYHMGLGYASQDLTHLARNKLTKGTVVATPPERVVHAQAAPAARRAATPVWGGAEY